MSGCPTCAQLREQLDAAARAAKLALDTANAEIARLEALLPSPSEAIVAVPNVSPKAPR